MNKLRSISYAWKGVYQSTVAQLELLTADEITRLSWARMVESYQALPEIYRLYLDSQLAGIQPFPTCILTPTFQGFLRQENEKLVFLLNDRLHVIERTRDGLNPISFALTDIDRIELGVILLKAWLTISGVDQHGRAGAVTLRFNAISERLFYPLIERCRCAQLRQPGQEPADLNIERARFDPLEQHNFKFMNYARRSLLPGEHVHGYMLQAEMRRPSLVIMGRGLWQRTISPAHLCILTEHELILIRDDPESLKGCDDGRYGGVWNFIPLAHIASVQLAADRFGDPLLALTLRNGSRVESLFAPGQRDELRDLVTAIGPEIGSEDMWIE
jgi:hypothetical protein